ncbi:MAG: dihydroorotate dehydrogenase-like protein [Candidatus Nealsonbacteria bacterium]|nr:dihydroorotate dehydrogenase-like protein [Candidatus Nealsonbacteria bacterium]
MSTNLSTSYLGLPLKNPLVIAACPLTQEPDTLRRLEDSGAAAAVLPSLFEEQIVHDDLAFSDAQDFATDSFPEALTFFPEPQEYRTGPTAYLEMVEQAKKAVSIPVIGSLNCTSTGGWTSYAKRIEQAGADALELNVYFLATDLELSGADVESQYLDAVAAVKQSISVPLAVKVGPYFSAMGNMAKRLAEAGADGLVLFNRFIQPDVDLKKMDISPELLLSTPGELLVPLRWVAILRGRIDASLAINGGIDDAEGLLKALLVGADVGMVASTLYRHGLDHIETLLDGLAQLIKLKHLESVEQLKGSMSRENCPDPAAFARGNYMKALTSFTGPAI